MEASRTVTLLVLGGKGLICLVVYTQFISDVSLLLESNGRWIR
jgi:hypothetical protein